MLTISRKAQILPASPIRKLVPYADAAKKRGIKVYHLNIGQPDIESPKEALDAVKNFNGKVIEYSNSAGNLSYREGLLKYYKGIGIDLDLADLIVTSSGTEAVQFALAVTCDPGDEVIVMEQGFRIDGRKLKVKPIDAWMYHYGWVKSPFHQAEKQKNFNKLWHSDEWVDKNVSKSDEFDYSTIDSLKLFEGTHPEVMRKRIENINWQK